MLGTLVLIEALAAQPVVERFDVGVSDSACLVRPGAAASHAHVPQVTIALPQNSLPLPLRIT
jgi:hypothetical protein